jgi:superoxide reductase
MDRRNFVRLSITGAAAGIVLPETTLAGKGNQPYEGGVYFTKASPGRWGKKATPHIPTIKVDKKGSQLAVQVVSPHPMDGYKHFIMKHILLDNEFNFLGEKLFDPTKDKAAISNFTVPADSYRAPLYALSVCNLHDSWLNMQSF